MKVVYTDEALRDFDDITAWLKANYPGIGTALRHSVVKCDLTAVHSRESGNPVRTESPLSRGRAEK